MNLVTPLRARGYEVFCSRDEGMNETSDEQFTNNFLLRLKKIQKKARTCYFWAWRRLFILKRLAFSLFVKNHNTAIFLAIAVLMLWANVSITTPIKWVKYPINPVLDLGDTWDDTHVYAPNVLFNGTKYQMWYAGFDGSNDRIGYATSNDGIDWNKHDNPVLDLGESGTWDDTHVAHANVLFDGTDPDAPYKMWYTGNDGKNLRIGYATSNDGIDWNKHDNPVLDFGESGTWDDWYVFSPTVLFDGTKYQMWYAGYDGSNDRIGYATSVNGIVWEKHSDNPVLDFGESGTWDDWGIDYTTVLFNGTEYQMWYTGFDGSNDRIGYATSEPIPEPTTIVLMSFGLLGLLGIGIRRRRKEK